MKFVLNMIFCACLAASPMAFSAEVNEASEPSFDRPEAVDLLAGGTLDAWKVPSARWHLEEGSIVGDTSAGKVDIPEWIYTRQRFGDFVFTCELKLTGDKSRNSGIYYRAKFFLYEDKRRQKSFEAPSGYEFDAAFHNPGQVNNRGTLADWYVRPSLRIFPDQRIIDEVYKAEQWNRMTIRARGNRLEYWLNAIKIMDFQDPDPKGSREGVIGFQMHNGSVMKLEYRNIRVLSLQP